MLLSCDRQLRVLIHSSVGILSVNKPEEAQAVLIGYWPQLARIKVLSNLHCPIEQYADQPSDSNLQLVASLPDKETCNVPH